MESLPRGKYTREFRLEAVKLVEDGVSTMGGGRRLSVPHNSVNNWIRAYKAGNLGEIGKGQRQLTETEI